MNVEEEENIENVEERVDERKEESKTKARGLQVNIEEDSVNEEDNGTEGEEKAKKFIAKDTPRLPEHPTKA